MPTLTRDDGYRLATDPALLDLDLVHRWLSTDAYWALGRSRQTIERAFAGSLPFGVYRPGDRRQVAVARVVTDGATFGWLCDVYVDPTERGRGLGSWLAAAVRDELAARGVHRILLATADAHGVYARLGFAVTEPGRFMELVQQPGPTVSPATGKEQGAVSALTVAE